ncbi:MAG: pyruvate kinase [Sulfolobales archaeon]|nr:pyruvate kinase [Sulfolobales archaeon]MDW8083541.1 pyruvate kinase [Sulfolobales archaeon]
MNVKIIASLGPASSSNDVVSRMVSAGASGFRVNFAHGDRGSWSQYVRIVRDVEASSDAYVALIGDLSGPSLRLGKLGESIEVKKGSIVRFTLSTKSETREDVVEVPVEIPRKVIEELSEGDVVLMSDGKISFSVIEVGDTHFDAVAQTDSTLSSRKAFTVRGREFDLPIVGKKDLEDLKFACSEGFDYIGLSYVRSPDDVSYVRRLVDKMNCGLSILSKIETLSALRNLDLIIEESDGVVIARGDLGMNIGLEEIPSIQKKIVKKSREYGKPVIVATQLLESMVENPVPTRAEVVDVYEAVQIGVDALMVTGETAVGRYPVEVVKWLSKIAKVAEVGLIHTYERLSGDLRTRFVKGVVELAEDLGASLAVYSMRGATARRASIMRPRVPTYVGVPKPEVARKLSILWGLNTRVVEATSYSEGLEKLYSTLISNGRLRAGDIVVLVYGLIEEYEEVIRIRKVSIE